MKSHKYIILLWNPGFSKIARVFVLFLLSIFVQDNIYGQQLKELEVYESISLSGTLAEVSGITCVGNKVYAINDSGNAKKVYVLDGESFEILESIKIKNSENIDWEEISSYNGDLYIGNFGNNFGNRKDLSIYKTGLKELKTDNQKTEKIEFNYSAQESFKSVEYKQHIWDCEAMVVDKDGIWLFSKDWENRDCRLYRIDMNSEPSFDLKPIAIFNTGYLVTGAFYDENSSRLFLCGYERGSTYLTIFHRVSDIAFSDKHEKFIIPELGQRQIESIFVKDNVVYLASERTNFKQAIYKIKLEKN